MINVSYENWNISVDRDLTLKLYDSMKKGYTETCGCAECQYFSKNRDRAYPPRFLAFLDSVGVDFRKEAEAYALNFEQSGPKTYEGWFHIIGKIEHDSGAAVNTDENGFRALLLPQGALIPENWRDQNIIQIEFHTVFP